jgi:hypothetical protein
MLPLTWFKFSGEIDPEEIYIPIDSSLVDDKGNVMGTGLMLNSDSVHMYSTFLTLRKRYSDNNVLGANGYLFFDKSRQEYKISNLKKLSEISMPGNLLSLSISECQLYGEGKINLGTDLGRINTEVVGNYNHYLEKDSIVIASMFVFDFFFVESSLEYMAKKITEYNGLEGVPFDRPVFERGLQEIVGKEEAGKLMSQLNLYGSFKKLPDELNKPIFFTDVRFIWDKTSRSYKSIGKIGIGNVFKKQINKYVDGYIEIEKKRSGDIMNIYLQLDSKNWYFFSYNRNVLYAISSDDEFNNS